MPILEFVYRSYEPTGQPRATANLLVDALQAQPVFASLADSVHATISRENAECRMVLSVEEEPPVSVQYAPLGQSLAVAYLTRRQIRAVLILLAAHPRLLAPDLQNLQARLTEAYPTANIPPTFAWLKEKRPPVAVGIYLQQGTPDTGVDTAAVAIAAAFFRFKRGEG